MIRIRITDEHGLRLEAPVTVGMEVDLYDVRGRLRIELVDVPPPHAGIVIGVRGEG